MKGNSKGLDAVKDLALKHGEKVVMALIVLAAGGLVYATFGHESLPEDRAHDRLESTTSRVKNTVDEYTWGQAVEDAKSDIRMHVSLESGGAVDIDPDPYALAGGLDPAVVPPTELRTDPELLPVTSFEGHGVTALFAFLDPDEAERRALEAARREAEREQEREEERERERLAEGQRGRRGPGAGRGEFFDRGFDMDGNENRRPVNVSMPRAGVDLQGTELIRQMSCAVLLARVPLPEQLQEYQETLGNTRTYDPSRDYPEYLGYRVQRAEVKSDEELEWRTVGFRNGKDGSMESTVTEKKINEGIFNWAQGLIDEFDPRYADPALTFPLAPLVGQNWGEKAYLTDVPLAVDVEEEGLEDEEEDAPEDLDDEADLFTVPDDTGRDFGGRGGVGGRGEFGGRSGPGAIGARGGFGGGEFGMSRGGFDGGRGGFEGGAGRGARGGGMARAGNTLRFDPQTGELEVDVPFLMLRFFDLTVQPGKRYKYRVQLIVRDPNYQQPSSVLDPSVLERERKLALYGDWSDPSPTISIPQAGMVRVAESDPPRSGYYTEPEATMLVESFGLDDDGNAMQASMELDARRGAVMNYVGDVEVLVDQGRYIEEVEDFTVDTGIVVLDLDGGDTYSRNLNEPTHALLMDASGRMYLRDELDDEMEVTIHRAVFEETDDPRGGRGAPGGRGGGGRGEFDTFEFR